MGLSISIPPMGVAVLLLIAANCVLGFGKSKWASRIFTIISTAFSVFGVVALFFVRPRLVAGLQKGLEAGRVEPSLSVWAMAKFDGYFVPVSIALVLALALLLLSILLGRTKENFIGKHASGIAVILMIVHLVVGVGYSLGAIHKLFDLSSYIGDVIGCGFFALYMPMAVKRLLKK